MMPRAHPPNSRSVRTSRLLRWVSSLLLLAGTAALAYAAYFVVSARYFQVTEAAKFDALAVRPNLRPAPRAVVHGSVIGMLEIPRLSVSAIIVQGDSNDVLRHAVGHIPGTQLPGQPGNVALAGHRDTIFRPLRKIAAGDMIELRTDAGVLRYRVSSTKIVPPSDVAVLESRGHNELTLVTCYPFYYVGHAPDRFIVTASEVAPPLH
jgi:sortase A